MVKIILILMILSTQVYADSFYSFEPGKGFYQYQDEKENIAEDKNMPVRPLVPSDEKLMSMPVEEFQKLVTASLNYALTVRSLDTYADYSRVQQAAFKRTQEFVNVQLAYAQLNPPKNENDYNRAIKERETSAAITEYLRNHKTEYGLIYLYSQTCSYCVQQTPLLEEFYRQYGWEIEAVDVEERPAVAAGLGVEVTPAIRIVDRNNSVLPISNGLISLPELEERAYRLIRYIKGETTELNFNEVSR